MAAYKPIPHIGDDRIQSGKQFAGFASDLLDSEIQLTVQLINDIRLKYAGRTNSSKNLEAMRDEVLTRLAEMSILAEFDPAPCLYGEPPVIEIVGKITGDPIHKYGVDHSKKRAEVLKSKERGEDYLGQKEPVNRRRNKK